MIIHSILINFNKIVNQFQKMNKSNTFTSPTVPHALNTTEKYSMHSLETEEEMVMRSQVDDNSIGRMDLLPGRGTHRNSNTFGHLYGDVLHGVEDGSGADELSSEDINAYMQAVKKKQKKREKPTK